MREELNSAIRSIFSLLFALLLYAKSSKYFPIYKNKLIMSIFLLSKMIISFCIMELYFVDFLCMDIHPKKQFFLFSTYVMLEYFFFKLVLTANFENLGKCSE